MRIPSRWRTDYQLWVECFVLVNITFLVLDVALAHSENQFRREAEYIPLFFSAAAPVILAAGLLARERWHNPRLWRWHGYVVGWSAVVVGLTGVIYHLDSQFFYERTLRSLTYAAPFAAPLAFTGLGLLLIMNRMVQPDLREWAEWLLLLALGGFAGNFVFSLTDHATNGFYRPVEWVPVVASAFAVSFLVLPLVTRVSHGFLVACAWVLGLQAGVGVLGFAFHGAANLRGPSRNLYENFINGAPPLAPLLLPNLALLAGVALWVLERRPNTQVRAKNF